jgi:hypothetical protein
MQTMGTEDKDRKGKPVERLGRKATGLNPDRSGHDSRAAEVILNDAFGLNSQKAFFIPSIACLTKGYETFEWHTVVEKV